jgi:hypothetical protein
MNATIAKHWTGRGIASDCTLFLYRPQHEFPRPGSARISQCEEETPQIVVALRVSLALFWLILHRREAVTQGFLCVRGHSQTVCVRVAAVVAFRGAETTTTAPPQQIETFRAEFVK